VPAGAARAFGQYASPRKYAASAFMEAWGCGLGCGLAGIRFYEDNRCCGGAGSTTSRIVLVADGLLKGKLTDDTSIAVVIVHTAPSDSNA
jgi:hypothetical protein